MLLLPFASALVLARTAGWETVPAAIAVVGVFLIREPLVALWRQARVWKERRIETQLARRCLCWYVPATAAGAALLLWRRPLWPMLAIGLAASALTAVSSYLIVHNRRRSLALQVLSAAGLNASALVAWLAVRPHLEAGVVWLWALQFAHSAAALLAVRARLEALSRERHDRSFPSMTGDARPQAGTAPVGAARANSDTAGMKRRAVVAQAILLVAAAACAGAGRLGPALALAWSGGVHLADLARLRSPDFLQIPLRRVGLRELALSVVFSVLTVAGLW